MIRVVSWNILGARGWRHGEHPVDRPGPLRPWVADAIAEALFELRPDIVALQECPAKSVTFRIADYLGHHFTWFPGRWAGDEYWPEGFPGALLTRWKPLESHNEIVRQHPPVECFQRHWGSLSLPTPAARITIHAYHCCSNFNGLNNDSVRIKELEAVAKATVGEEPCILVGDHNCQPGQAPLAAIADVGFADAHCLVGQGKGYTDPADIPFQRIDQCWFRGLRAISCYVPDGPAFSGNGDGVMLSDHRPLVIEFDSLD